MSARKLNESWLVTPLPVPPLLLITDRLQARRPLAEIVAAACEGGVRWISVREKDLAEEAQIALCRELATVTRVFGALLSLHGSADLAQAAGCAGVHLPAGESSAVARKRMGPAVLIGQSIHDGKEAAAADPEHVDYVVAGPAFETASKPGYGPALRIEGLAGLKAACRVPLLALGGIDRHTLGECRRAGVDGIAVMGGVMRAPAPAEEVRALLQAWTASDTGITRD